MFFDTTKEQSEAGGFMDFHENRRLKTSCVLVFVWVCVGDLFFARAKF